MNYLLFYVKNFLLNITLNQLYNLIILSSYLSSVILRFYLDGFNGFYPIWSVESDLNLKHLIFLVIFNYIYSINLLKYYDQLNYQTYHV